MFRLHRTGLSRPALWARIAGAHLPIERDGRDFAEHLAEITGFSPRMARLLEREYRRFVYLAVISSDLRMPPGLVRVAWSYHAEHDGYAQEFTQFVLGRPLVFTPTVAMPARAYTATVAAYLREFAEDPPPAIWPDPEAQASLPHWHGGDVTADPLTA